ncbi:MAG: RNA polymerase Rpb6 [Crocinitomicaceae bacterium]|nr:RNA polymerase Rpb6 [Crocinitomicaceae bacterium]|tara:strand:- start:18568 stop:18900 length:333 start_codon:yes stop_codon:yes gene_type:complete
MDYKKTNAATTTITRDVETFKEKVGNVYGALVILSKRSNQINQEIKEELTAKLEEFATTHDNLEEIFENREQIEISKYYERLPKPANIAIQELLDDKVYFRKPEEENKLI